MAGKTRPSLRKKTLLNVIQSNLSITDKKCIGEVFKEFEELTKADIMEVVRCADCKYNVANINKDPLDETDYSGEDIVCSYFMTDGMLPTGFCSYGERKDAK